MGVLWTCYGFTISFGTTWAVACSASRSGLTDISGKLAGFATAATDTAPEVAWPGADGLPLFAFVMFQLMFAIITPALISGAIADRASFGPWPLFVAPLGDDRVLPGRALGVRFVQRLRRHVTRVGGWIANKLLAIDFAGGTAVHINAGAAGLALAIVLGKRVGWPKDRMKPHSLPLVVLGAGLLWFGWFGFNAGSALAANTTAGVTLHQHHRRDVTAMLAWLLVERVRDGHATTLGAASGVVAGLVAITPSCSAVTPVGAIAIGRIAGALCALAIGLKFRFGFDDSLDVVGVHLVGGLVGTLLIGLFGTTSVNSLGVDGLFYGGGFSQLGKQALAAVVVLGYSFVLTFIIGWVIKKLRRVPRQRGGRGQWYR